MITGRIPGGVDDGHGRMPHQRAESIERLAAVGGNAIYHLAGFFDRTFARITSDRFSSALEMKAKLEDVLNEKGKIIMNIVDKDFQAIKTAMDSQANKELIRNKKLYDEAMAEIESIHRTIQSEVAPTYLRYQTGFLNFAEKFQNILGFSHFSSLDKRFTLHFEMTIEGDELVIAADSVAVHRTGIEAPTFGDEFQERVRSLYVSGLLTLI